MIKQIGGAAALAVFLAVGWYAYDQHQRADAALDRAEAVAESKRAALEGVYAWYRPYVQRWQDSARRAEEEKQDALARMDSAEATYESRMDALLSTAPPARRPQLLALDSAHSRAMNECTLALKACEAEATALSKQLRAAQDSLLPVERRAREAEEALAEQATEVARPGIFTRVGQGLELVGIGVVIGGAAVCAAAC